MLLDFERKSVQQKMAKQLQDILCEKKRPISEQFCYNILNFTIKRSEARVNIILALGSSPFVPTPVWRRREFVYV